MLETIPDPKVQQHWPLPGTPKPIVVIGAGGIVSGAHLPAYDKVGLPVHGIHDLNIDTARATAAKFAIPNVFEVLDEATACRDVVFDIAVPASAILSILERLPGQATVLIQKPMGEDLAMAGAIREKCRAKGLTAAINHQLRFAPQVLAARSLIEQGAIGEILAMEVRVTVSTPWHLWDFLEDIPRVEILYNSVHYLDLMRAFLGEPRGAYCRSLKHPSSPRLAQVRSYIILDYGDDLMVGAQLNHNHGFGLRHQESYIKWEGTLGAIKSTIGILMNYPAGVPDSFEYCVVEDGADPVWNSLDLEGTWFPDAFTGAMSNLQRYAAGEDEVLHTSVEDVYHTMALVEACYLSNSSGATRIPE